MRRAGDKHYYAKKTHFTFCFFTSLQFILSALISVFLLSPIVLLEISVYLFSICKDCRLWGLIWVGTGNVFRGGVQEGIFPTTVKFDPKTQNCCNSKNVVAVVQGFLSKTHLNILSPVVCTCVCVYADSLEAKIARFSYSYLVQEKSKLREIINRNGKMLKNMRKHTTILN